MIFVYKFIVGDIDPTKLMSQLNDSVIRLSKVTCALMTSNLVWIFMDIVRRSCLEQTTISTFLSYKISSPNSQKILWLMFYILIKDCSYRITISYIFH